MKHLLVLALTLSLSSCATEFKRQWEAAGKQAAKAGVEGRWEGTWKSEVNGHHGSLRAIVGPALNPEGDHCFHYHATWKGWLQGAYQATHRVTKGRAIHSFSGQHQMPKIYGGAYTYSGRISGDEFSACYQSAKDKGTYQMRRVR